MSAFEPLKSRKLPWITSSGNAPADPAAAMTRELPWENETSTPVLESLSLPSSVKVYYIITAEDCKRYANEILKLSHGQNSIWGFDVEWRVEFKAHTATHHKVSLLQMYRDNIALLFQLSACGMQPELVQVLLSPHIYKVGLNIGGDMSRLHRDYECLNNGIKGVVEVRRLANHLQIKPASSLAGMVEQLMKRTLAKPDNIRRGNWELVPLSAAAKAYAALDAFASYMVMKCTIDLYLSLDPSRLSGSYSEFVLRALTEMTTAPQKAPVVVSTGGDAATATVSVEKVGSTVIHPDTLKHLEGFELIAPSSPEAAVMVSEQKRACLELHLAGASFESIGAARGIKASTAASYVICLIEAGSGYNYHSFAISPAEKAVVLTLFLDHLHMYSNQLVDLSAALKAANVQHPSLQYHVVKFLKLHWMRVFGEKWLEVIDKLNSQLGPTGGDGHVA